ncbi:MAG: hypothetical protein ACFFAD_11275 [Candidatus Hermodarchaeota archaeon]
MASKLKLVVDGEEVHMNEFVANVFRDVVLALLNNLRDIELNDISKIEIS